MLKRIIFSISIFVFLAGILLPYFGVFAQEEKKAEINFFYSETCPHCKKEKEFLKTLGQKYPEVEIKQYEVINSQENQKLLSDFYDKYNVPENEKGYVPVTFTPTKYFVGFNDQVSAELESCLLECIGGSGKVVEQKIRLPFFGEVDVSKIPLPLLTVVLGVMDGFNPCAMWVLVILVSMLLAAKSRKKILLVGGTFILAEGLLYFLFMSAWLNVFLAVGYVSLTRALIGIFGIIFGVWRIREFITWRPGVCKVTEQTNSQDKILDRINKVMMPAALPATVLGVVALAFGVNLVEFFCSAGFPVMYTRILSLQGIQSFQYYLYLFFYNIFYMLDDFIVFGVAFFSLNRFGFSDKYNKYSTLVAGALILILGIIMIIKPELLMFG